jgi:hypothetical protein
MDDMDRACNVHGGEDSTSLLSEECQTENLLPKKKKIEVSKYFICCWPLGMLLCIFHSIALRHLALSLSFWHNLSLRNIARL